MLADCFVNLHPGSLRPYPEPWKTSSKPDEYFRRPRAQPQGYRPYHTARSHELPGDRSVRLRRIVSWHSTLYTPKASAATSESFSAYARQFLGSLERPDVDKIDGLSPVISIEQKTTSKNPRSTVGTITEIYDFLRLLYARASDAFSPTGELMVSHTDQQIQTLIEDAYRGQMMTVLAPVVRSRKGHYRELFENILKMGFLKARIDGQITDITSGMRLDRYKTHDIEIVIDRISSPEKDPARLAEAIRTAMYHGEGTLMVQKWGEDGVRYYSRQLMCPSTGVSYPLPEPNTFSFNSPKGAATPSVRRHRRGASHRYRKSNTRPIPVHTQGRYSPSGRI